MSLAQPGRYRERTRPERLCPRGDLRGNDIGLAARENHVSLGDSTNELEQVKGWGVCALTNPNVKSYDKPAQGISGFRTHVHFLCETGGEVGLRVPAVSDCDMIFQGSALYIIPQTRLSQGERRWPHWQMSRL